MRPDGVVYVHPVLGDLAHVVYGTPCWEPRSYKAQQSTPKIRGDKINALTNAIDFNYRKLLKEILLNYD